MQCKNCGSELRNNVKYCTQCGKPVVAIRNEILNNTMEQNINFGNDVKNNFDASGVKNRKIFIGSAVAFVVILIILVIIFNGGSSDVTESDMNNNTEISTEQIINMLTTKNQNNMANIIALAEVRLRNELNYLDKNKTYLFMYDYKVIGDTINFYIIAPEQTNFGYVQGYNIYGYKASYTITNNTKEYMSALINKSGNTSNKKTNDVFKINKEETISSIQAPSDSFNQIVKYSVTPQLSDILNYVP